MNRYAKEFQATIRHSWEMWLITYCIEKLSPSISLNRLEAICITRFKHHFIRTLTSSKQFLQSVFIDCLMRKLRNSTFSRIFFYWCCSGVDFHILCFVTFLDFFWRDLRSFHIKQSYMFHRAILRYTFLYLFIYLFNYLFLFI